MRSQATMPVIKKHAPGEVLDMRRGFDENGLYGNLAWLAENQGKIEQKLFESRRGEKKPKLFLYDLSACNAQAGAFVVMFAYIIIRRLRKAWEDFDLAVEDGVKQLATVYSMEVKVKGQNARCLKIPRPRKQSRKLLLVQINHIPL